MRAKTDMPYSFETHHIHLPANKDRRAKLTPEQRIAIKDNPDKLSQRILADMYGVSRRTIQFIQNPKQLQENRKRREERGGWRQYHDPAKRAEAMREHRRYKKKALASPRE